jgi:hypothetical protein
VVLVLKLVASDSASWSFGKLGKELGISSSHAFESVRRAETLQLLTVSQAPPSSAKPRGLLLHPRRGNLLEFLIHGVRYVFGIERGGLTRGIPTAEGAFPLCEYFPESSTPIPVWPDPGGTVRGFAFSPLYKNVPDAARKDPKLHELLALVDAVREGRARERAIAIKELTTRIELR